MPHLNYLYDYTVTAFIITDPGRVLLVNHPRYNKWIPVGGHIETNEDPEEALFREVHEETGLDIEVLSGRPEVKSAGTKFLLTPHYIDVHEANPPHKHISFTYFVKSMSDTFVKSDEHDEMRWFGSDELDDARYDLSPAIKFYAREALRLL